MARHADKSGIPASGTIGYVGTRRAKIEPAPRPPMGQPRIGETAQRPSKVTGRAAAQPAAPFGPVRHGGQRAIGPLKSSRMGYKPQHSRSVASQTKRDRAGRRETQRKAGNAFAGALRALWALGKS